MALAVRIVALAMSLTNQRREFLGEPARRLAASGLAQAEFPASALPHVAAVHEVLERRADLVRRVGEKARDRFECRGSGETLAFDPVQQFEELVASGDFVARLAGHSRPSISDRT